MAMYKDLQRFVLKNENNNQRLIPTNNIDYSGIN